MLNEHVARRGLMFALSSPSGAGFTRSGGIHRRHGCVGGVRAGVCGRRNCNVPRCIDRQIADTLDGRPLHCDFCRRW